MSAATAVLEHWVASQATCWSNTLVCPASCRAQGTAITVGPCTGQATRGASASRKTFVVPWSRARQRRRPRPRSYQWLRRWQTPQRRRSRAAGRTRATIASADSSKTTSSITVRSTPNSRFHILALRTPFPA
jgi:hypothetical protein